MRRLLAAIIFASFSLLASTATAHGIYGHMHVTGWAVENMPDNELKEFLSEPEVFEALLYGAAFTDSGYWIRSGSYEDRARAYAEYNHWPPFVYNAIEWLRTNDPPPLDSLESRKRVAFVMGIAAHGLQDEVFDSLFLYQVQEHDNAGQDEADRGTDGFMFLDDHVRMRPTEFLPLDMLLELYGDIDEDVDEETIGEATHAMSAYLDEDLGPAIGRSLGEDAEDTIPWSRQHYLDPNIPGSLRAEIIPTMHHLEAVWERIHGRWSADDLVIHTYPATPRRLLSHDHSSPDSWVTFIFGKGVEYGGATGSLIDADGADAPYNRDDTRWGGPGSWTRLATLKPTLDLIPGGYYTAGLSGDVQTIGGESVTLDHQFEFQVGCAEANTDDCPELVIEPPTIDDPDTDDAGGDTETSDAGSDALDAEDASLDADTTDPPPNSGDDTGGCTTTGDRPAPLAAAVLVLWFLWRRHRPQSS
ncbi:MAG: MYXO-CTERM sorting domain-containing protein [Myxococcota bacterium]